MAMRKYGRRLWMGTATGAVMVAGGVIVAPYAMGSVPAADGSISGCYRASSGTLRVIDSASGDTCRHGETALTWNKTGPRGPKGDTGAAGPAGPKGDTVLSGTGAPTSTSPANPQAGDFYINTSAHEIYGPYDTTSGWPANGTSLVGPTGTDGTNGTDGTDGTDGKDGAPGPAGADGTSVLNGTGAPTGTSPANPQAGDFYIDTSAHEIYGPYDTTSGWPADGTSLVGPKGDPGSAAAQVIHITGRVDNIPANSTGTGAPTSVSPSGTGTELSPNFETTAGNFVARRVASTDTSSAIGVVLTTAGFQQLVACTIEAGATDCTSSGTGILDPSTDYMLLIMNHGSSTTSVEYSYTLTRS